MRFEKYLEEEQLKNDIVELVTFIEFTKNYNVINEGIGDSLNKMLNKLGLHANATGAGIIPMLMKGGKKIAELFWYAMKAMTGDRHAKEKVIEIANTEITKEELMTFLLKLDSLTFSIVSKPLRIINALTGWNISPIQKGKDAIERIKRVIDHLMKVERELESKVKNKVREWIDEIKLFFGFAT